MSNVPPFDIPWMNDLVEQAQAKLAEADDTLAADDHMFKALVLCADALFVGQLVIASQMEALTEELRRHRERSDH